MRFSGQKKKRNEPIEEQMGPSQKLEIRLTLFKNRIPSLVQKKKRIKKIRCIASRFRY